MRTLLLMIVAALCVTPVHAQAPSFFIERIEIANADRVSAGVILYESRLTEGREYSELQLREASDRLRRLPFVLDATFALQKGSERDRFVLAISVREAKPLFFLLDTVLFTRDSNELRIEGSNDAILGARFFAGPRGAFHFGAFVRDPQRPFDKSFAVFQGGYTRYDVLGTGALVTVALNQVLTVGTNRLFPEAVIALPVSSNQTVTASYSESATAVERESIIESRWSYNTTNDPFFPTRGTLLSAGPFLAMVDGATRPCCGIAPVVLHRRAAGAEVEVKRNWELPWSMALGAELLAGAARIDRRRGNVANDFTQGYGEGLLRLSRALSDDERSPSRLELTLRALDSGGRFVDEEDAVTQLSLSWARRNAWGALRLGVGYAW